MCRKVILYTSENKASILHQHASEGQLVQMYAILNKSLEHDLYQKTLQSEV